MGLDVAVVDWRGPGDVAVLVVDEDRSANLEGKESRKN